jgi:dihydrofolate reductase
VDIVVAVSEDDVIGRGNALPWHLPDDLRHFKAVTLGKPILLGRRTFESIGRALPGRRNLVLSREAGFRAPGTESVGSLEQALSLCAGSEALMVIGGAQVFDLALPAVRRIHLTRVHTRIADGDVFFRGWRDPAFTETDRQPHPADERHAHAFSIMTLVRRL